MPKRAIALAGGGPAAALHIGALEYLREQGIAFDKRDDVWALSCIGAWVGIVYNQCDKGAEVEQTKRFFRDNVYRDDVSYSRFPINAVFGPDLVALTRASAEFLADIESYRNIVLPGKMFDFVRDALAFSVNPKRWNQGDVSKLALEFSAAHPFTRFLTSMMYLSNVNGLSKMYYKNSTFLNAIDFKRIKGEDKPFIFHNAFNLATKQIELFANREPEHRANLKSDGMTLKIGENGVPLTEVLHPARKHKSPLEIAQELKLKLDDVKNAFEYGSQNRKYELIDASTLCACSALPYIEETVRFESGAEYCEGALVDTVNFKDLIEDHDKIDEIWVSKIVDFKQINAPKNVYDALGNLCMLFAATVGDDDIRLFKYHALLDQEEPWRGEVIEIDFGGHTNFDWSHKNFDEGVLAGRVAAEKALRKHRSGYFKERAKEARDRWRRALEMFGDEKMPPERPLPLDAAAE
ncbi:MAG: patatin-like phospholipase family protein [Rhodoplanes sp.]|jgi:predicted acylesterase/phospholipase RssA